MDAPDPETFGKRCRLSRKPHIRRAPLIPEHLDLIELKAAHPGSERLRDRLLNSKITGKSFF